ncbi:glycosyltransferase family 4 protein [Novipirellula artificiosorum]|uniref:D-inositol 3-phosphate glycosyltransferase n=1 Tax=Novipirellula artificiosorum TaxID=2528016 RepID=A0A5C6DEC4_9BACT|nr:glycosyltransferase family 4 protein [Novipirellula artificiosorum]TWU35072.1 D-inositol 3-phosphate glycosyltransferase [Novipirellula artificiosorum]
MFGSVNDFSLNHPTAPVLVPIPSPASGADSNASAAVMPVRVLHVVNGEHFAGAERVQSHLGRCLPQFAVTADFVCVKPGKFPDALRQQPCNSGRCHCAEMRGRFDLRAALRVKELVKTYDYDLLHAHTPRTAMIASVASRLSGIPWVYHVHSPAARDSANKWSNRVNFLVEHLSLHGCSHLITVSESLRLETIAKGAAEEKVTVVHNGVPTIRLERDHTPTPGGRWVIGMVALMRPRKGLEVVLQSLATLKSEGHDVVLRIIGPFESDEYRSEIEQQIERLGVASRIERVGFTQDVPAELAKMDALVLPSLFGEGLPMVVLEAMAAAVPVIATRVEGTPEAITDGVEGLLAEPRDPITLADKIRSLVTGQHDWKTMGEAAHQRQSRCFSDVAMAEKTAAVYRKLMTATDGTIDTDRTDAPAVP